MVLLRVRVPPSLVNVMCHDPCPESYYITLRWLGHHGNARQDLNNLAEVSAPGQEMSNPDSWTAPILTQDTSHIISPTNLNNFKKGITYCNHFTFAPVPPFQVRTSAVTLLESERQYKVQQ